MHNIIYYPYNNIVRILYFSRRKLIISRFERVRCLGGGVTILFHGVVRRIRPARRDQSNNEYNYCFNSKNYTIYMRRAAVQA